MLKVIGITGGIGSAKTTVAKMFGTYGIPVYIADQEAKSLMNRSKVIRRKLIALFGDKAYTQEGLNKKFIADKIFNNKLLLKQMNEIVHPKVASHFKRWLKKQNAPYVLKEAAILFENGSYKQLDAIITVTASMEDKINRVIKRDNTTRDKILAIMGNQWDDTKKIALSDYVIKNDELENTMKQVAKIHQTILKKHK